LRLTKERIEGDLSNTHSIAEFAKGMKEVAEECFRVLKPDHFCAILIGDIRRNLHYIPMTFRTLQSFLEVGFILREDIIKHQWQCKYSIIHTEGAGLTEFLFNPFFSLEVKPSWWTRI
jgi:hypothetical protein